MTEVPTGNGRLDSWKAIADYLGRDVATARRWEKTLGLPVRRVPGGRGHSVFAYVSEIDGWLRSREAPPPEPAPPAADPVARPSAARRWRVAAAAAVIVLGTIAWLFGRAAIAGAPSSVDVTTDGVTARDGDGTIRWRYPFDAAAEQTLLPDYRGPRAAELLGEADPAVIFARACRIRYSDRATIGGDVSLLSRSGELVRSLSFDDRLAFGDVSYTGPWAVSDFRVAPGAPRRIAIAARHYEWWPGLVTITDGNLNRLGTFVNAGWVLGLHWLSRDSLLVAGYSNERKGAMLAVLDARHLDGQSPGDEPKFRCRSCGPGQPSRYIVMPRSELNLVTGSPFNQVSLTVHAGGFTARTVEVPANAYAIDALYEFSPALEIRRASYSDRYWELHRTLEASGKLTHTREHCADRNGPRAVDVWAPATGWHTTAVPR